LSLRANSISGCLYRVLALLLVVIAAALTANHIGTLGHLDLPSAFVVIIGVAAGFLIGVVAALMGVAGGELLIPTIVLLFGTDIKVAGSLSLLVSLPTMIVAFARYSRDGSFSVLRENARMVAALAIGSVAGTVIGGLLLGVVSETVLGASSLVGPVLGQGLAARPQLTGRAEAQSCAGTPSSPRSVRTRRSISSRTGRTSSTVLPAGSSRTQSS